MKVLKVAATLTGLCALLALQGCWFAAGAATGAATAKVMQDEGYEIESPIQKKDDDDDD